MEDGDGVAERDSVGDGHPVEDAVPVGNDDESVGDAEPGEDVKRVVDDACFHVALGHVR